MFKFVQSRILWGTLLILGGVALLLQNLIGFNFGSLFWAAVLGLAGVFFLTVYLDNREHWWALIPGGTLLGASGTILVSSFLPNLGNLSGAIVLFAISASFWLIYLLHREHWWAIIPGGVMLSIALLVFLEDFLPGESTVGVMFLGFAGTFTLVALIPTTEGRMNWAWIPAGIMGVMGLFFMASAINLMAFIWPLALIGVGLFFILRAMLRR